MIRLLAAIISGLLLATVSGCSSGAADQLKISYDDGRGTVQHWNLTCGDQPSGSHPDPADACAALDHNADEALPSVPPGKACTLIYGGPEKATITGTWGGDPVNARLSRGNGCEIARSSALKGLLPQP